MPLKSLENRRRQAAQILQIFLQEISQIASLVGIHRRFFAQECAAQIDYSRDEANIESRPILAGLLFRRILSRGWRCKIGILEKEFISCLYFGKCC